MKVKRKLEVNETLRAYLCRGPFVHGISEELVAKYGGVCVHGWNTGHYLSNAEADKTQHLISCGVIKGEQNIDKVEENIEK